jgi:hypothetical protein
MAPCRGDLRGELGPHVNHEEEEEDQEDEEKEEFHKVQKPLRLWGFDVMISIHFGIYCTKKRKKYIGKIAETLSFSVYVSQTVHTLLFLKLRQMFDTTYVHTKIGKSSVCRNGRTSPKNENMVSIPASRAPFSYKLNFFSVTS